MIFTLTLRFQTASRNYVELLCVSFTLISEMKPRCCRITVMCEKNESEMESSNSRCIFLSLWLLLYVAGSPRSPKTKLIQKQQQKFQNEIKQKRTQTHTHEYVPHHTINKLFRCCDFAIFSVFFGLAFGLSLSVSFGRVSIHASHKIESLPNWKFVQKVGKISHKFWNNFVRFFRNQNWNVSNTVHSA